MVFCCFGGNFEKDSQTPSFEYAMANVKDQRGNNSSTKKLYPSLSEMSDVEGNEKTLSYNFSRSNIGIKLQSDSNNAEQNDNNLFVDKMFHHEDKSTLNNTGMPTSDEWNGIVWKRPKDMCLNPKFFVNGSSRFDIVQNELGDCWFLAAISSLAMRPDLLQKVVVPNQTLNGFGYTGKFKFRFWHFGQWNEVVIDDYLPLKDGKLIFGKSSNRNEFWTALLEKAYAKFNGSYQALNGGFGVRSLTELTGGCVETYNLEDQTQESITNLLLSSVQKTALMMCGSPCVGDARKLKGIKLRHAYTITKVVPEYGLIRIRNPWGRAEWTGAWSDHSSKWKKVSPEEKAKYNLVIEDDGEFYMSFKDFHQIFQTLTICNISHLDAGLAWNEEKIFGSWRRNVSAGGYWRLNGWKSFATNPQFKIVLEDVNGDNYCTVIIALMQKSLSGSKLFHLGFQIYQIQDDGNETTTTTSFLDKKILKNASQKVASSHDHFPNYPEVTRRFQLRPGNYAIVPSTWKANQERDFLVRVFSENECNLKALKH